jgi:hypothetical protein
VWYVETAVFVNFSVQFFAYLQDQKLVQSSGATERLRLWDKFCTSNIDPEAVKINFLRHSRISQYYPRKRIPRVKLNPKNTAKVMKEFIYLETRCYKCALIDPRGCP